MYDIGLQGITIEERKEKENGDYIYVAKPIHRPICSNCGSTNVIQHKKNIRSIRDLKEFDHRVGIELQGHQYKCKDCNALISEEFDFVEKGSQLTNRLKAVVQRECFSRTFKSIAEDYDIAEMTVKRLFNAYVERIEDGYSLYSPEVLGMDEVHLHKDYRGVFVDVTGQCVIEMTKNRSKATVIKLLNSLPDKENIICVTMDMWQPYKDAVREALGDKPIIIDKFHVIKELNAEMEGIRRNLRKEQEKDERVNLKNMRFLMLTGAENLTKEQNHSLNEIFKAYPQFEEPYLLKEAFRNIYQLSFDREEAEEQYKKWLGIYEESGLKCYDQFIKMIDNWYEEIFNYFDNRYTNAQTESLNNVIREIDRSGRGYTFEVLRAKMLFRNKIEKKEKFSFKD